MKQGAFRRGALGVCCTIRALLLGSLIALAGCRMEQSPTAGLAPQPSGEPQETKGKAPSAAEAGHVSLPLEGEPSEQKPQSLIKFEEANGFEIYQRYCMVCHGESGEGDGFNAFNLDPRPRSLIDESVREQFSDEDLTRSISLGGAGRNKSPLMPRWGHTLSSRQIRYVVAYIRLLQKQVQPEEAGSGDQ